MTRSLLDSAEIRYNGPSCAGVALVLAAGGRAAGPALHGELLVAFRGRPDTPMTTVGSPRPRQTRRPL
jgi:hypothetical protein